MDISGETNIPIIYHDDLTIFLSHPLTEFPSNNRRATYLNSCNVIMYHMTTTEHVNDVSNRARTLETISYSASRFKCLFRRFNDLLTQYWSRVGNSYDQAQLRSIKMADAEHGEFRLSRIVSTRHGESHGTDWFFGCEKLQRQGGILQISGRENFGELIVTVIAYWS